MSFRTGVSRSTSNVAKACCGWSLLKYTVVTSPTRMPLKSTAEPLTRPATEPVKTMRICCRFVPLSLPENHSTKPKPAAITARVKMPMMA